GIVREAGLKVVLTGEGADELLAGYDVFREDKIRRFWARDPESVSRPLLLRRLYGYLPRELPRSRLLEQFFARGLTETSDPFYSHRIRFDNTARCARLLERGLVEEAGGPGDVLDRLRQRLPPAYARFSSLSRAQYLEIVTFLEGYLLHAQGDRM